MTLKQIALLLRQHWPGAGKRQAVTAGYRALGMSHQLTLTDIGLRNGVFSTSDASDPTTIAYQNGRRDCALEIFRLAKVSPEHLYNLIETKPHSENRR